jgi:hypothetical protein
MVLHRRAPYNPQPSILNHLVIHPLNQRLICAGLARSFNRSMSQSFNGSIWKAEFGLFRFRSPLLTESLLLSLPPGTEMVHFPGFARTRLWIQRAVTGFCPVRFPHSEIPGSMGASPSPRLIAGSHVLLRRPAPRHPPYALSSLTIKSAQHTRSVVGD